MANKEQFDHYANNYNDILSNQLKVYSKDTTYFAEYKVKLTRKLVNNKSLEILDYGCGIGRSFPYIKKYFPKATISGFDVSGECINILKQSNKNGLFTTNLEELSDGKYDIILMTCVLHHIPSQERISIFKKIRTLLSENGVLVIFEHNQYNYITRKLVRECEFDKDAELITISALDHLLNKLGYSCKEKRYTLFFFGFLRFLIPLERFISWLPLGGQYIYIAKK